MQTYAVYLKPKSSFITLPTSDTIFGALCWAIMHLYGEEILKPLLTIFNKEPKFILSSAFPYLERDGTRIRFFPKPLIRDLKSDHVGKLAEEKVGKLDNNSLDLKRAVIFATEKLKDIKKISYVSEILFKEIVENSLDLQGLYEGLAKKRTIEKIGSALISLGERESIDHEKELKTLFNELDVLRNQIDRVAGSTVEGLLFYNKEVSLYRNYGGLWFLVKTNEFDFLKPLFRYLEDTGVGGDRTTGKGHFEISWDEKPYPLPEAENPNSFIILSRWFPNEDERDLANELASWNLINLRSRRDTMYIVGGNRILKDFLRVFSEGSVFPLKIMREYYGTLVPAGNMGNYTAYHNGITLPVYAKIGDKK
jgi:CRISPR-associated protein Csm4